ncbi:unnamed protein product [Camellia sinensis]
MPRVTTLLRKSYKAIHDFDLLKALQSEIRHEQSSNHFQDNQSGSLGDFVLDWDSPQSQDVVLRKKCESGEEVAVSALLGPETYEGESSFPREALMKVCVKKPGLSSILQFDCGAFGKGDGGSEFAIHNAYYIPSSTCLDSSIYKGPSFRLLMSLGKKHFVAPFDHKSSLDPHLQDELKNYLVAKGIEDMFTNFVLLHLHRKEQGQYVKWLHKLEEIVAASDLSEESKKTTVVAYAPAILEDYSADSTIVLHGPKLANRRHSKSSISIGASSWLWLSNWVVKAKLKANSWKLFERACVF